MPWGDPNNFVGRSGNGYDVYVGGRFIDHYDDLNQAQNAYNQNGGPSPNGGSGGFNPSSWLQNQQQFNPAYWQAQQAAFNQAYLDNRLKLIDQPMLDIEKDRLAFQKAIETIGLTAQLRGPRNAFQQQAVMSGLNKAGLSNAVDAVLGKLNLPGFQAPQESYQPATLATMADDLRRAGVAPPPEAAGGQQATMQDYVQALPNLNKINARNFLRLPQDTQQFLVSGYEAKGASANDLADTIKNLLPQFSLPSLGRVA